MKEFNRIALAGLLTVFALPTYAVTLDFFCITGNVPGNCAIGEA